MTIRITDLASQTTYTATTEAECHGADRHAFAMAELVGDVITMGKVIADPNNNPPAEGIREIAPARK